ncbi:hypothetical protein [Rhabdothermincola salaria]|uniref:hypothetical protein n=1 Tax=Rhabdothermincola salaria TaxID=2903142 RepID=UPI001E34EF6B|nr:hypothetical protein [Rhabdothermincola salaria]MCD9624429.1 hypothetical protein [Rhabdothermincola salaria]
MAADFEVARKARIRRLWSSAAWWIFVAVFVYNAAGLGQAFFWIPAALFGVAAAATTRLAFSSTAPERFAPWPDALAEATEDRPFETPAHWAAFEGNRPSVSKPGRLRVADGRISFFTLDDEVRFDLPVEKIELPLKPSFSRPMLQIDVGESRHLIRMFPVWDLGATFVGPVVVGEWYDQLHDLGAS